jgi:hypothetical protein
LNYENGKAATPKYTPPIEVLINASKVLRSGKKEKEVKLDLLPTLAPPSVDISNQIIKDLEVLSDLNRYLSIHYPEKQFPLTPKIFKLD